MQFSEVIGHKKLKQVLRQAVINNHISHAQMVLGNEGSGTLLLAIAYAQYINCTQRTNEDSCGTCPSCLKYNKLIHPDLHFVFPTFGDKKKSDDFIDAWRKILLKKPYFSINDWLDSIDADNKQGYIGVEESKSILKKHSLKTYEAEYKSMIIWLPELMNTECANKLLKILEEPPEKTLFLLVAESTDRILPTIISRTQLLKAGNIDLDSMSNYLIKNYNLDGQRAIDIARLSGGSMVTAHTIMDGDDDEAKMVELFQKLMRTAYTNNIKEILLISENIATMGREKIKYFIRVSMRIMRESFIMQFNTPELEYTPSNEIDFTKKFSKFIPAEYYSYFVDEFTLLAQHIEANGNAKIVVSDFSLQMIKYFRRLRELGK